MEAVALLEAPRTAGDSLKKHVAHMIFWLANHATGFSWDTVAQLCFREAHDCDMMAVHDG